MMSMRKALIISSRDSSNRVPERIHPKLPASQADPPSQPKVMFKLAQMYPLSFRDPEQCLDAGSRGLPRDAGERPDPDRRGRDPKGVAEGGQTAVPTTRPSCPLKENQMELVLVVV